MALARRTGGRFAANIWPGFVDAMTALVLVLMFVLSIFMVVQFVLRETISGQESELEDLSGQLAGLIDALGLEQNRSATLSNELGQVSATLDDTSRELRLRDAMILDLTNQRHAQAARIATIEDRVTALLGQNESLSTTLRAAEAESATKSADLTSVEAELVQLRAAQQREINEKEALQLVLARLRTEVSEKDEAARLAAAQTDAMQALIASLRTDLQTQSTTLDEQRTRIGDLATRLTETERQQLADAAARAAGDAEIIRLRERLSDEETARVAQLAAIAAKERDIARLETNLKDEESQRRERLASIAAFEKRVAELDESLESAEAERLAQIAALAARDKELAALAQRISEKNTSIATAEDVLKLKDEALADLSRSLSEAESRRVAEAAAAAALLSRFEDETAEAARALQARIDDGSARIEELEKGLSDAEKLRLAQIAATEELRKQLAASDTALETMTLALEEKRKAAEDTLKLLAAAEAAQAELETANVQILSEAEKNKALAAQAQALLVEQKSVSVEDQKRIAALNQQTAALRRQLAGLQALLGESEDRDREANVQIEALGSQLNAALAQTAAAERRKRELEEAERKRLEEEAKDLKKARSDFLARTQEILGTQEGVEEVGDRFVFSSEVLFGVASADLSAGGEAQISRVAEVIKQVAAEIPADVNWILRVDGHTDNTPLRGGQFADNWELSQARALAVVRYLINAENLPADRLSANGFGEYQPVDRGESPEALARNRRIEIKFTEK